MHHRPLASSTQGRFQPHSTLGYREHETSAAPKRSTDWALRVITNDHSAIVAEADKLHESAVWSSQGQFEAAKLWRTVNWIIGFVGTGASLTAGVLAFAQNQQLWIAVLAIAGALSTAVQTTLNPGTRSEGAHASAQQYLALRNRARQLRDIYAPAVDLDTLLPRLGRLTEDFAEVDRSADPIPRIAYRWAKRNIEKDGGQSFEVDHNDH